jgi:IclR family transcriptional regulator, acetate operon repressor
VATPLLAPDGSLIAAISAAIDPAPADRLDDLGEELKKYLLEEERRFHFGPGPAGSCQRRVVALLYVYPVLNT